MTAFRDAVVPEEASPLVIKPPHADAVRRFLPIILGQAFGLACGIAGVRLTSTLVPADTLGRYSIFLTFASVGMWAVHAGVIKFTVRHWAHAPDQRALARQIARAGARKLPWLVLACLGGAWATDPMNWPRLWPFLVLAAISLSTATIAQIALQAAREYWRDSAVLAVGSAGRSFLPPLLFAASQQALALYVGFGFSTLLLATAGLWALHRSLKPPGIHGAVSALPAVYEGPLFVVLATAGWALLGLGRWIMAFYFGVEATGYFSLASNLATLVPSVLGTIFLLYFQPGFFAAPLDTPADRAALAQRVDRVALTHAACALLALFILRWVSPWLIGPLIAPAYAPALEFLLPAGCFALAITTGHFYHSLLLAGNRESSCGPVEFTAAGVLVAGSIASAAMGQIWFLRWMLIAPVVPWLINRPLARRY
ncbi:MAG: lipopolysaccharide biosynthesis protein, partial [Opitutaceae bacterium]